MNTQLRQTAADAAQDYAGVAEIARLSERLAGELPQEETAMAS